MNVGVYITGHGFGHASRMAAILNELSGRVSQAQYYLRTSVPEWFFQQTLNGRSAFHYAGVVVDVGVVQQNVFRPAKKKTLQAFEQFWTGRKSLREQEVEFCKGRNLSLIVADIPPLAFEIADRLEIKSIGVANFSWDWIYRPYVEKYSQFAYLIEEIRAAYNKASMVLRLPFSGELSAFPEGRDLPLVTRVWTKSRSFVHQALKLDDRRPIVLITFGGFDVDNLVFRNLEKIPGYAFVTVSPVSGMIPGITHINEAQLLEWGITMPDLINASDIVVGKPGYGMVSECIANRKPFVYTSRGDFAEYPPLVKEMKKYLPCVFIPHEDLFSGKWCDYLERAISLPWPRNTLRIDGAAEAAERILELTAYRHQV